jgi:hypothetical protein
MLSRLTRIFVLVGASLWVHQLGQWLPSHHVEVDDGVGCLVFVIIVWRMLVSQTNRQRAYLLWLGLQWIIAANVIEGLLLSTIWEGAFGLTGSAAVLQLLMLQVIGALGAVGLQVVMARPRVS